MAILVTPTVIFTSAFTAFVMQVIISMMNLWSDVPLLTNVTSTDTETEAAITRNLNILQSHPRCGLTFDKGREECWWGCDRKLASDFGYYIFTVIITIITESLSLSLIIDIHNNCQSKIISNIYRGIL